MRQELKNLKLAVNKEKELPVKGGKRGKKVRKQTWWGGVGVGGRSSNGQQPVKERYLPTLAGCAQDTSQGR
jgi:hypothetical protein